MTLSLAQIDGPFSDSDLKFEFYPDRRLKAVNATSTGRGETILKSAISLVGVAVRAGVPPRNHSAACKRLKARFGDDPLTVRFAADEDFSSMARVTIPANTQSLEHYRSFRELIGEACIRKTLASPDTKPVSLPPSKSSYAMLEAKQPAYVAVTVSVGPENDCEASSIWNGTVAVGQLGAKYEIPIPRGAAFGNQVFAATFDDAGTLTTLQYGKEVGTAGAIGVLQSGYDAARETEAERASRLSSEADVIAAQQRLVKCQASPESC